MLIVYGRLDKCLDCRLNAMSNDILWECCLHDRTDSDGGTAQASKDQVDVSIEF